MVYKKTTKTIEQLQLENNELRECQEKAEEALHALRISAGDARENELSLVYQSMSDGLALHRLIYNSAGIPVDYSLLYVNPSFERITGLSKTEILGRRSTDVYSVKKAPFIDIYSDVAVTGQPTSFETFFAPMKKHFQISVFSPGKDKFATVFQDITERKQTEEVRKRAEAELLKSKKLIQSVLDNVNSGVALIDEWGRFAVCNPLFLKLFGLSEDASIKNVNDQNWADWQVFNEQGTLLHADEHPVRKAAKTGKRIDQQLVGVKLPSGGDFIWMLVSAEPLFKDNGDIENIICTYTDITGRRKSEQSLAFQSQLLSNVNDAVFSSNSNNMITYWNKAAEKMFGWTIEEALGKNSGELLKPKVDGSSRDNERSKLRNIGHWEGEAQYIRKDGTYFFAEVNSTILADENQKDTGNVVIARDITGRKKIEEALHESEERYHQMFNQHQTIGLLIEPETGAIIDANPAAVKYYGYTYEQLCSLKIQDINQLPPSEVEAERKKALTEKRNYFIFPHRLANGEMRWVEVYSSPLSSNGRQLLYSIIHDITSRKNAEELLRVSEERFSKVFKNSPNAVTITRMEDGKIIEGNDSAYSILGYRHEEVVGKTSLDLGIWTNIADRLVLSNALASKGSIHNKEFILRKKDGTQVPVNLSASLIMIEKEQCFICSFIDLTDRKRAENERKKVEEKLSESETRYKELVTNARSMILKFDIDANITFINDYALEFFGYKLEELLGKSVMTVVPKVESTARDLDKMIDNLIEDPDINININENVKKNGDKVWVEWHNKTIFNESGMKTGQIAIGVDITKKRLAEENLKESERKLRSVLNATLESIYMSDIKGIICMANSTAINRLKRNSEAEVIGHHFSEFLTPEVTAKRQKMHNKVIDACRPFEFEDERDHRTYHNSLSPVIIGDSVQFVVTYSTDITERRNSELKLKFSEDRLRTIAESLTVMINITRMKDSITLFANEPYLNAYGFSSDSVLGKKDPDIFVFKEDRTNVHDILKSTGYLNNHELKVKRPDGTQFWIITSIRKINYMGDISFLASSIDITETKRTQEELIRLNRTLNAHSKSSQAMLHSSNEFSYLNEVCKIIIEDCGHSMIWVGYAQDDEKKTVSPVAYYGFDKGYINQLNVTWDDSDRGRGPTGTAIRTCRPSICRNMLSDPRFEPWREAAIVRGFASSLVLPLMSDGKSFGSVSIYSKEPDSFSDSEIDLLNDLADDLAHGISYIRLTESERSAARVIKENEAKLKELVVTKDKFFNIIAHDLKNPFTSLLGSSELLYDNINQMTTENVKKLALILNDSAKGGYAILQNLLDWSRSQTGMLRYCPSEINLRLIIDENVDNFNLQASNKEITLKTDLKIDKIIIADKNMINTVLRNLISNAIKFTHKNGSVIVITEFVSDEIVLCVSDTGVGMPQDKIDQLFQLDNSLSMPGTEKEQGTGLGLKLCKEFTEIMGGRIWAESEPGKGSRFSFTIPLMADRRDKVRGIMNKD